MTQTKVELIDAKNSVTISGSTPTLTIGDAGAEDTKLVFDGNAQDFYIGLDDSADDLLIGLGSTVGTTPAISIAEDLTVNMHHDTVISNDDNQTTLTITSTHANQFSAPILKLYRNSSSPADSDQIGYILFDGRNDNSQDVTYYKILSHIADASDGTEDANVQHQVMTNGSLQNYLSMNSGEGEVCINDGQIDLDFRVESNGNGNMFIVDAGAEHVGVGTGSDYHASLATVASGERALFVYQNANSDTTTMQIRSAYAQSSQSASMIVFQDSGGTERGSIKTTGSATAYNTSSDYRLKENVDYTWDATTRLKQLKPARFNWIADDTNTLLDGFIAHEVSSVVPEAVSGEKDAMEDYIDDSTQEEKTRIKPQGIDQAKLVPLMVKTIQELEARIATLEG